MWDLTIQSHSDLTGSGMCHSDAGLGATVGERLSFILAHWWAMVRAAQGHSKEGSQPRGSYDSDLNGHALLCFTVL